VLVVSRPHLIHCACSWALQVAAEVEANAKRREELQAQLKAAESQLVQVARGGTMYLLLTYIWAHWLDGIRRSHCWASVFTPPVGE